MALPELRGSLLLHLINDAPVVALVVWLWMPIVTRLFAGWLKKTSSTSLKECVMSQTATLILTHGQIHTLDRANPLAEAVAIADGKKFSRPEATIES